MLGVMYRITKDASGVILVYKRGEDNEAGC